MRRRKGVGGGLRAVGCVRRRGGRSSGPAPDSLRNKGHAMSKINTLTLPTGPKWLKREKQQGGDRNFSLPPDAAGSRRPV